MGVQFRVMGSVVSLYSISFYSIHPPGVTSKYLFQMSKTKNRLSAPDFLVLRAGYLVDEINSVPVGFDIP